MITIEKIKEAVDHLPEPDYAKFREWFTEHDWEKWDKQIDKDSQSGALSEKKYNSLKPL